MDAGAREYAAAPIDDWMRAELVAALVAEGCPSSTAARLASSAQLHTGRGRPWRLQLHEAHHEAGRVRVTAADFAEGAARVAEVLRDVSAEAIDRRNRGEAWPPPYWEVSRPDRHG